MCAISTWTSFAIYIYMCLFWLIGRSVVRLSSFIHSLLTIDKLNIAHSISTFMFNVSIAMCYMCVGFLYTAWQTFMSLSSTEYHAIERNDIKWYTSHQFRQMFRKYQNTLFAELRNDGIFITANSMCDIPHWKRI